MVDTATLSNITLFVVTVLGMYAAAFWIALIIWTYRDHRARSRDGLASVAAALMVAVLFIPGLLIYLLLRPRETLAEAYERSLEEEALLQEIEEKAICPGCGRPANEAWQVCPYCHTTLKKACINCGEKIELGWQQCPFCATVQPNFSAVQEPAASSRPVRQQETADYYAPPADEQSLEFIDNDPYRG